MQRRMSFLEYHIQVREKVFVARPHGKSGTGTASADDVARREKERRMLSACGATILAPGPSARTETLHTLLAELKDQPKGLSGTSRVKTKSRIG